MVWEVDQQFFIVALYHDKVPDLNSCLALPGCKPKLARMAIRVVSAGKMFKFGNIIMIKVLI